MEKVDVSKHIRIDTMRLGSDKQGVFFMVVHEGLKHRVVGKIYISEGMTFIDPKFSTEYDDKGKAKVMMEVVKKKEE
jgi:hypothetical protein